MAAFTIEERAEHVVVVYPEFGDGMRTAAEDGRLGDLVRRHSLVIIDLTGCRMLDTPWIRLITMLSTQADQQGRRVAVVGASDELRSRSPTPRCSAPPNA
jgi:hypothetical protein